MLRKEIIIETKEIEKFVCSDCNKVIATVYVCHICGTMLCDGCNFNIIKYNNNKASLCCHSCFKAGKPHIKKIKNLYDQIKETYNKWELDCKKDKK